jgi:hypothetical protein
MIIPACLINTLRGPSVFPSSRRKGVLEVIQWYVQEPMRGSFMLTLHTGGISAQKNLGLEMPSQFSKAAEMFSLKEILSGLDM